MTAPCMNLRRFMDPSNSNKGFGIKRAGRMTVSRHLLHGLREPSAHSIGPRGGPGYLLSFQQVRDPEPL